MTNSSRDARTPPMLLSGLCLLLILAQPVLVVGSFFFVPPLSRQRIGDTVRPPQRRGSRRLQTSSRIAPSPRCSPFISHTSAAASTSGTSLCSFSDVHAAVAVIETFDGTGVVDPVVVSNVFWGSLKAKLLSIVIGQVLAIVVFGILSSLAANQLRKFGDYVSNQFSSPSNNKSGCDSPSTAFRKFPTDDDVSVTKIEPDFAKLLVCIAIDLIGTSSELVPGIGELTDVVWAPIAAVILRSLYGGNNVLFALEFLEEILPFTDILPLATLSWVVDTFFSDSVYSKLLRIGRFSDNKEANAGVDDVVVDVQAKPGVSMPRLLKSSDEEKKNS